MCGLNVKCEMTVLYDDLTSDVAFKRFYANDLLTK